MATVWTVGFPVKFYSGGDTTREAFGKHIQEIERIYGYLNLLNSSKVEAGDISTAITNAITNLKNTWKPKLVFGDIDGDLPAYRVSGDLTKATIDKDRVNGLKAYVDGKISEIPAPENKGDGITKSNLSGEGFVRFANGFEIKWGQSASFSQSSSLPSGAVTFSNAFTTCYAVTIAPHFTEAQDYSTYFFQISGYSNTGFSWKLQSCADGDAHKPFTNAYMTWIALGYTK